MMGRAHALSGAAAWLAGAPLLSASTGWFYLDTGTWLMGSVVMAGAALAPDLDHPSASSARNSLKPITPIIGRVVNFISGGHRQGTHSILGVALFAFLMVMAAGPLAPWGVLVTTFFLSAFACKALGFNLFKYIPIPGSQGGATILTAAAATFGVYWVSDGYYGWFIWAAAVGFFVHLAGDLATYEGLRPLAPWQWEMRVSQMRAGGPMELLFLTPLFIVLIVWAGVQGIGTGKVFGHPVETGGSANGFSYSAPWSNSPDLPDEPSPSAPEKPAKKNKSKKSG